MPEAQLPTITTATAINSVTKSKDFIDLASAEDRSRWHRSESVMDAAVYNIAALLVLLSEDYHEATTSQLHSISREIRLEFMGRNTALNIYDTNGIAMLRDYGLIAYEYDPSTSCALVRWGGFVRLLNRQEYSPIRANLAGLGGDPYAECKMEARPYVVRNGHKVYVELSGEDLESFLEDSLQDAVAPVSIELCLRKENRALSWENATSADIASALRSVTANGKVAKLLLKRSLSV